MSGKVFVVIYTMYHHVYKLGVEVHKGLEASGVQSTMYQVQETLSEDILKITKAPPKPNLPIIRPEQLSDADGILFGFPTRFGTMPSQMKALLDGTGRQWANGDLYGKFAGTFFSTAAQHGGQETTALTSIPFFAHHGMPYIPLGFPNKHMFDNDRVIGGSPWGSGTVSNGDNTREPTAQELEIARQQGEAFGRIVGAYVRGRAKK